MKTKMNGLFKPNIILKSNRFYFFAEQFVTFSKCTTKLNKIIAHT